MIGKRGDNLRQISRQTGAELMRKDGNVYLTSGTEEQRQHVQQLITELVVSLASCKVTRITESGIQGFVIWNSAQGIRNPSSFDKESGIQVPLTQSGIRVPLTRNPESKSFAVVDPDLQIRRGGGGGGGGRAVAKEIFFRPFGPQFVLKMRGAPLPLDPPNPESRNWNQQSRIQ